MQYRKDKYGNPVSVLGYGCMRFTQSVTGVNLNKAESEIMAAVNSGINYFDTAYIYPGSEAALGEILEKNNVREKVNIATKLPHYLLKTPEDADRYFNTQLARLRTDHVEYYLMHMLNDTKTFERLKSIGIEDWIKKNKESGKIGQIGFSYHGNSEEFCRLVDAYPWDFCMIQYNYMDENSQAGKKGIEYAAAKGLPVMIMEPLRGGKLAGDLPQAAKDKINAYKIKRSPAIWSFSWLWNQQAVTCVLSGMNSLEMIKENTAAADMAAVGMLSGEDMALIESIKQDIRGAVKVGCTGCRYCIPCPKGVDIPGIFSAYNRSFYDGKFAGLKDYYMCTVLRRDVSGAGACIECGKCEKHCPQGIEIRKELKRAAKRFEKPYLKLAGKILKKVMKY